MSGAAIASSKGIGGKEFAAAYAAARCGTVSKEAKVSLP